MVHNQWISSSAVPHFTHLHNWLPSLYLLARVDAWNMRVPTRCTPPDYSSSALGVGGRGGGIILTKRENTWVRILQSVPVVES